MSEPQVSGYPLRHFPIPFSQTGEDGDVDEAGVPELENGDRLTRAEFERRYAALPHLKKAELIKGGVYVGSPVKHKRHSKPHSQLITWLGVYAANTPGTETGDNGSVRLDDENAPQPDAILRILAECGGQSAEDADDYLQGTPELVVEVASSSVSYDLHDKKDVYGQFGAQEYLVWRTRDEALDWFRLENHNYVRLEPDANGVLESRVFPGLRLAASALLKGDMATVLAELQQGLVAAEHQAFVESLQVAKQQT
jgi:Uma2 family endonuclease